MKYPAYLVKYHCQFAYHFVNPGDTQLAVALFTFSGNCFLVILKFRANL
jgi:hypothetical protein